MDPCNRSSVSHQNNTSLFTINLTNETEKVLRKIIQLSSSSEHNFPNEVKSNHHFGRRIGLFRKKLLKVYDELAGEGFFNQQIELAFQSLYSDHAEFSLEDAFDWLCLNLPSHEIPSHFSSGIENKTGDVKVVLGSQAPKPTNFKNEKMSTQEKEGFKSNKSQSQSQEDLNLLKKKKEDDVNQKSVKEWTKQYLQKLNEEENKDGEKKKSKNENEYEDVSEEDDDWEKNWSDDDIQKQDDEDDSIWEIWADYREISRRKNLRSKLEREDKLRYLAKDFFRAKNESMDSQTKRNKKKQKEIGAIIQELKQEMKESGILEQEIYAVNDCKDYDKHKRMKKSQEKKKQEKEEEVEANGMGNFASVFSDLCEKEENAAFEKEEKREKEERNVEEKEERKVEEKEERKVKEKEKEKDEEEEDVDLPDLFFNEEAIENQNELFDSINLLKKKQELLSLWKEGGDDRKGNRGSKKAKQTSKLQPKALLQQHCQKHFFSSPKFEKMAEPSNSFQNKKYFYSVSFIRNVSKPTKVHAAKGESLFKLPAGEDGFDSISEAQNAVSAYALYSVTSAKFLYNNFDKTYQEMLLNWCLKGTEKAGKEETELNRREDFISSLLSFSGDADKKVSESSNTLSESISDLDLGEKDDEDEDEIEGEGLNEFNHKRFQEVRMRENDSKIRATSRRLLQEYEMQRNHPAYKEMQQFRSSLPIFSKKESFLSVLKENDTIIVCGETGSGKTTQIPQFILDDMILNEKGGLCNIICTQPRKIAAISVSERVCSERCENILHNFKQLIGYQVRLDSKKSSFTRILFCTTGILLRQLSGDNLLLEISHVVVDEIHERTMQSDFLLAILKEVQKKRKFHLLPPLKIILMSATLDSKIFSNYFSGCPVVFVEGRTFSVKKFFLEDIFETLNYKLLSDSPCAFKPTQAHPKDKKLVTGSGKKKNLLEGGWGDEYSSASFPSQILNPFYDANLYQNFSKNTRSNLSRLNEDVIDYDLLEELIFYIDENFDEGAILVFLPGIAEIRNIHNRLSSSQQFQSCNSAAYWLLTLHSSISSQDQSKAFVNPPKGIRKIVLATNIAETSITINDVVFVIDSGKVRENRYDPKKSMTSLVESWISKSNAKQRFGRAGRVKEGICFNLYTKHRYENIMRHYQIPEIQRLPLVELCLQIKLLNLGSVETFLNNVIEPPSSQAINEAMNTLLEVGALDSNENLTCLGNHLAMLPVDIRIGKIMIMGCVLGCLSTVLTIASCLSHKSPFVYYQDQKVVSDQIRQMFCVSNENKEGDVKENEKVKEKEKEKEKEIEKGKEKNDFKKLCMNQNSDHLVMAAAYIGWRSAAKKGGKFASQEFCQKHFCSPQTLEMIRDMRLQFGNLLSDIGFFSSPSNEQVWKDDWIDNPSQPWNVNANNPCIVKAVLCAGLYPHVAAMDEASMLAFTDKLKGETREKPHWTDGKFQVFVHPSSINFSALKFQWPFIVYHEKVKTEKLYVRDCSTVSPFSLLLFGGKIDINYKRSIVSLDSWLKFRSPAQTSVLFKQARKAVDSVLQQLILNPRVESSIVSNSVIPIILKLLMEENKSVNK